MRHRPLALVSLFTVCFGAAACEKNGPESEARARLASILRDSLGVATEANVAFIVDGRSRDRHLYVLFDTTAFANLSDSAFVVRARDVARFSLRHYEKAQALDSITVASRETLTLAEARIHHTATFAIAELRESVGKPIPPAVPDSALIAVSPSVRCYRSSHSVLLGPITKSRQNARGPGWLRVESIQDADSGRGELVDATRAGLSGLWRRGPGDSVSMTAADDFLRVELRLVISDSFAMGPARAISDADLERDASGQLRTFRRDWVLRATRAACDSMPIRSAHNAS
jgi:hypothetical protein